MLQAITRVNRPYPGMRYGFVIDFAHKCVSCGACARACKMDVDITKTPNHAECIRCGMCMKACPTDAIQYKFGLGDQSNTETTKE